MRSAGRTNSQIKHYRQREVAQKQKLQERQQGFAGWLLTEPQFVREREALVEEHESRIVGDDDWPVIPHAFERSAPGSKESRQYFDDSQRFLNRWCLEGLDAGELPRPLNSGPISTTGYSRDALQEGGLTLFSPWFLFADQDLTLRDVVEHELSSGISDHLRGWITNRPANWGHQRFGKLLMLYVYLHRCLHERYGTALRRKTGAIDAAFATFFEPSDVEGAGSDSVRKIRQELSRRLKVCRL